MKSISILEKKGFYLNGSNDLFALSNKSEPFDPLVHGRLIFNLVFKYSSFGFRKQPQIICSYVKRFSILTLKSDGLIGISRRFETKLWNIGWQGLRGRRCSGSVERSWTRWHRIKCSSQGSSAWQSILLRKIIEKRHGKMIHYSENV